MSFQCLLTLLNLLIVVDHVLILVHVLDHTSFDDLLGRHVFMLVGLLNCNLIDFFCLNFNLFLGMIINLFDRDLFRFFNDVLSACIVCVKLICFFHGLVVVLWLCHFIFVVVSHYCHVNLVLIKASSLVYECFSLFLIVLGYVTHIMNLLGIEAMAPPIINENDLFFLLDLLKVALDALLPLDHAELGGWRHVLVIHT